jgi:Ser/Thr protein kinase RdoA (MazF antagonist)
MDKITNVARCTREIKSRTAIAKAAFNSQLFTSKLDLNAWKKLVKCYIVNIALSGAQTWTLKKVDQKHLESSEMWYWRRMEKISWPNSVNTTGKVGIT